MKKRLRRGGDGAKAQQGQGSDRRREMGRRGKFGIFVSDLSERALIISGKKKTRAYYVWVENRRKANVLS